jgi:Lipopolysaccharide-assembly
MILKIKNCIKQKLLLHKQPQLNYTKQNNMRFNIAGLQIMATRSFLFFIFIYLFISCGPYSFKDISIPPNVKTVQVKYFDNKARYVNPQLSPQLSNKLRQKVNNQTRLKLVQADDAHYDIGGYVSDYNVTTSGISNQQAASNRLNVTVHIIFKNRLNPAKDFEADVTRNFDFSANLTLAAAEAQLNESIINNMTDEIFNRIFSDW